MDHAEARETLLAALQEFRAKPYADLVALIDAEPFTCERDGATGTRYQLEVQVFWDDLEGGDVRVIGAVDDGRWRAFHPLSESFIKDNNGDFVDE